MFTICANHSVDLSYGQKMNSVDVTKAFWHASFFSVFPRVSAVPAMFLVAASALITLADARHVYADDLDFNRDVQPILSDKCYFCHGPDEENRAAGLRFDVEEEARDSIDSGEFIDRVLSDDEDYVMPKPESHLFLTDAEKTILEKWVDAGAKYEKHWAFVPLPTSVEVPDIAPQFSAKNPIDHFVIARLEEQNLRPSEPASPLRWLRRVTLDLTGLPPDANRIRNFESAIAKATADADAVDAVYAETVDGLLNDDNFGQHMAVGWLDVARYADSYGYQSDKLNTQWPYRDWVVRAFNENLPYDKFITWQLAGDLLENPTEDQRLATAFNRIHRLNNEGGAIFEEWRLENVADRVHTYGSAMLGLTFECCRCHDHKYDPISARDYYSLSAFFNSIDENGLYDRTEKVPSPTMLLPTDAQATTLSKAAAEVLASREQLEQSVEVVDQKFVTGELDDTIAKLAEEERFSDLRVLLSFDHPWDKSQKEVFFPSTNDRNKTTDLPRVAVEQCEIPRLLDAAAGGTGAARMAMQLDGEKGIVIEDVPSFDRWTPFTLAVTVKETVRGKNRSVIAHHTRGTDAGYNGWDLTIQDGYLESRMYRVWPGNAMGVRTIDRVSDNQWHQIVATYDGSDTAEGLKIYVDGILLQTKVLRDAKVKSANVLVDHGGKLTIGQRFRDRGLAGGLLDQVVVFDRDLTTPEIVAMASGEAVRPDASTIAYSKNEAVRAAWKRWLKAQQAYVDAEEAIHEIPVMKETPKPRTAHVLARGAYDAPTSDKTIVSRRTPESIEPKFSMAGYSGRGEFPDRLSLARWTVDPHHPLTGRVTVNRLWANFFGAGLVRTPENFGLQGELPTHPKLLDWLARDFIDHGWDLKRFCKQIVLSSTYRQSSVASAEVREADPENRMLARAPSYRLSAEQIRDGMLAASGLLNPQAGGPPVSPYQPGGDLWKESNSMSPPYEQSVGEALHRRSLYSVWKRTAPLPNMMAFDATSREVCTIARSRTNTPLQALVLLNDVQFVEAARHLAGEVLAAGSASDGNANGRAIERNIGEAFLRLTSRDPDSEELKMLVDLYEEELDYFSDHPDEAKSYVAIGQTDSAVATQGDDVNPESKADAGLAKLAALSVAVQAIMNLDATFTRR